MAQTRATDTQMVRASKIDTQSVAVVGPRPPDTGALFVSSDGISIFWQKPSLARKPFLLRARQYIKGTSINCAGKWGFPEMPRVGIS